MSLHGEFVSDDSQYIRIDEDESGTGVRVLFFESWYDYLKPLYDYIEFLMAGMSIEDAPDYIVSCLQLISAYSIKIGAYGWTINAMAAAYIVRLVKNRISIGKFTYEKVGFGREFGTVPFGGGTKLLELPVAG